MKENRLIEIPVFFMGALCILMIILFAGFVISDLKIETTFTVNGQIYIFVILCACVLAGIVGITLYRALTAGAESNDLQTAAKEISIAITLIKRTKKEVAIKDLGQAKIHLNNALQAIEKNDQARKAYLYQAQESLEPKIETA